MLGAIIGDIVGSRFEYDNIKTKEFDFFAPGCAITDDSVLTIAVAEAFLMGDIEQLSIHARDCIFKHSWRYAQKDYGDRFRLWMNDPLLKPYNSFGNGAAMRVSPCCIAAKNLDEVKAFSYAVTAVTHNHPEGIKGAEAAAVAGLLAKSHPTIQTIENYINEHYYSMDFTLDQIRDSYDYDVTCQGTVLVALKAFFESTSFEDAIRNAISVGGDSDTIAAITGGVAGIYYGTEGYKETVYQYLDNEQIRILEQFTKVFSYSI